ncbi:MAG: hypothetical protein HY851_11870 [candidate division Zixibacteria bacterium]|nr:hypothetical protein [candidate division Zixibacteria bacterium]
MNSRSLRHFLLLEVAAGTLVAWSVTAAPRQTRVQPYQISRAVVCNLDQDSALVRSWADITIRSIDSLPRPSVSLHCNANWAIDSILVDGVRIDMSSANKSISMLLGGIQWEISLHPSIMPGQSRSVSVAYHWILSRKDLAKATCSLPGLVPQLRWDVVTDDIPPWSSNLPRSCVGQVEIRLSVSPPALAVGEGDLLNEAEFVTASSKPRDTVLTDLISLKRFPSLQQSGDTSSALKSANYLFRAEEASDLKIVLLCAYTLDRTWVGETPVDLYYPRQSKDRWSGWAVSVIAKTLKDSKGGGNLGSLPLRFIVAKDKKLSGSAPATIIPDKKFSAEKLRTYISERVR